VAFAALFLLLAFSLAAAAADPAAVARGAYLAAVAGCDQCHTDTKSGGSPYAGGRKFATEFGTITTPNITSDRMTGIGDWSTADFVRAMCWGVAPDTTHYVPSFPFSAYSRLSEGDLADLKAFLDSLPAISRPGLAGADSLALAARAQAALGGIAAGSTGRWQPDPNLDAIANRGAYLVATVGRCGDCHTPNTLLGAPDPDRFLAGAGKKAPNITPDPKTGIGNWSEADIVTLLKDGQTPEVDFVGGAMAEIVRNTVRLTDADRQAIAAFLKSVPPKVLGKNN